MEQTFFGYVNDKLSVQTFHEMDEFDSFCEEHHLNPNSLVNIETSMITSDHSLHTDETMKIPSVVIGWIALSCVLKAFTKIGVGWTDLKMVNTQLKNVLDKHFIRNRLCNIGVELAGKNNLNIIILPKEGQT